MLQAFLNASLQSRDREVFALSAVNLYSYSKSFNILLYGYSTYTYEGN